MKIRLIIWLVACITVTLLFFRELAVKLPQWLSIEGLQQHGVFHWGVLGLCFLWLWLKRADISPRMQSYRFNLYFTIAGILMVILSVLLPQSESFIFFEMLLGWLGIFTIIFGRAAILPSALMAIYAFSIAFPILMNGSTGELSVKLVIIVIKNISGFLGIPLGSQGQIISFTDISGNTIYTGIVPGCAGYATIGVFIALFALMMLDIRLPIKKAWYVFLIGLVGTWLQNLIRLMVSIAAGYFWGREVLEAMHYNAAYVIFPLWYLIFVWIYLSHAGWRRQKETHDDTGEEE